MERTRRDFFGIDCHKNGFHCKGVDLIHVEARIKFIGSGYCKNWLDYKNFKMHFKQVVNIWQKVKKVFLTSCLVYGKKYVKYAFLASC